MINKLKELHEDLTRRAKAAREVVATSLRSSDAARCAGKAAAYEHAAQLVQTLIDDTARMPDTRMHVPTPRAAHRVRSGARKTTKQRAVEALETALNDWAAKHKPGWRAKLDPTLVTSNGASRRAGYDCASWEVCGTWTNEKGIELAACLAVWDTMTIVAKHGAAICAPDHSGRFPSEACSTQ